MLINLSEGLGDNPTKIDATPKHDAPAPSTPSTTSTPSTQRLQNQDSEIFGKLGHRLPQALRGKFLAIEENARVRLNIISAVWRNPKTTATRLTTKLS